MRLNPLKLPWTGFLLSLGMLCSPNALGASVSAEAVKAAYLYHFGSYVEWPSAQPQRELVIGVVGGDHVLAELRTLLPGRTIHNRPVRARALAPRGSLEGIHILYIGRAAPTRTAGMIKAARAKSILVITDDPEGLQRGGMINFVLAENRVRFEISRSAAENAGLKLSSRLLAIALRVHSSGLLGDPKPLV